MNTSAIVMMVVAILLVWGGLAVAVVSLRRGPNPPTKDEIHDL